MSKLKVMREDTLAYLRNYLNGAYEPPLGKALVNEATFIRYLNTVLEQRNSTLRLCKMRLLPEVGRPTGRALYKETLMRVRDSADKGDSSAKRVLLHRAERQAFYALENVRKAHAGIYREWKALERKLSR